MTKCPIKSCSFNAKLVLCPVHWDMVSPEFKLSVYQLSNDLLVENIGEIEFTELAAKLREAEQTAIDFVKRRLGE